MYIPRPVPCGELMGPREVLYVVQQQLRQLETADPFTDDYYYIMARVLWLFVVYFQQISPMYWVYFGHIFICVGASTITPKNNIYSTNTGCGQRGGAAAARAGGGGQGRGGRQRGRGEQDGRCRWEKGAFFLVGFGWILGVLLVFFE